MRILQRSFMVLVVCLLFAGFNAGPEAVDLFVPLAVGPAGVPADIAGVALRGTVERMKVDFPALEYGPAAAERVRISLRGGKVSVLADRRDLRRSIDDTATWYGKTAAGNGSLVFSTYGESTYGLMELEGDGIWAVEPAGDGSVWVYERDWRRAAPMCGGGTLVPPDYHPVAEAPGVGPAGPVTVDLYVLYTPGFAAAYPGDKLNAQINFLIGVANTCYKNSKVKMTLRLVGKAKENYTDEGSLQTPLQAMALHTGVFSDILTRRDKAKADQVTLLRVLKESNGGVAGLAYVMSPLSASFEMWAYSVVQVGKYDVPGGYVFARDQTLAHELGHNHGSNHNAGSSPSAFPYSLGHRFGPHMSVMSYAAAGEQTVSYFSNPKVQYSGMATGTPQLNNGKSLKKVRKTVGAWR